MAEKSKFKDALLQAAKNLGQKDASLTPAAAPALLALESAKNQKRKDTAALALASALEAGSIKPAVLEGLAEGVAPFLPKFRKNTNVASIDWAKYIPLLEMAIGLIAHRLGL